MFIGEAVNVNCELNKLLKLYTGANTFPEVPFTVIVLVLTILLIPPQHGLAIGLLQHAVVTGAGQAGVTGFIGTIGVIVDRPAGLVTFAGPYGAGSAGLIRVHVTVPE